jgi:hypothetical protein
MGEGDLFGRRSRPVWRAADGVVEGQGPGGGQVAPLEEVGFELAIRGEAIRVNPDGDRGLLRLEG